MIYLDSCALVKLVRTEMHSGALQSWLDDQPDEVVLTSELAQTEVPRAIRRGNHTDQGVLVDADRLQTELAKGEELLSRTAQLVVDSVVLRHAGMFEMPMLRSLDAIHLATAFAFRSEVTDFVTYDRRLAEQAKASGLDVVSPS